MYLRDSKTRGINTGNTKYSFTTAAAWRLALTFLEVFHLHRSLTTYNPQHKWHMTQDFLADCLWIFILQNVHSCYTIAAFILVDIAFFLIVFAACSLICLAITLCTDLMECVGLSLITHQYENNWLFFWYSFVQYGKMYVLVCFFHVNYL